VVFRKAMNAHAWIRRHKNDDPNDLHLYIDTCKDEADKWVAQFKEGYAWLEPLVSIKEMEILFPIVEAAKGLAHGEDWNNGTHARIYRPKLIAALRALERHNDKVKL